MITVGELLTVLADNGIHCEPCLPGEIDLSLKVEGFSRPEQATVTSLCWVARGKAPVAPWSFDGALVFVSDVASVRQAVVTSDPKLAFVIAAGRLSPEDGNSGWMHAAPITEKVRSELARRGVHLAPGVVIGDDVVFGENVLVGPNTVLQKTSLGSGVRIGANCSIGGAGFGYARDLHGRWHRFPHVGRVIIEGDVIIGSNTCIDRGSLGDTIVEEGARIDNLVHVAHNVRVGARSMVIADAMLGGSAQVGCDAWVAPGAMVRNQIRIGDGAVVGMGAIVTRDVQAGTTVAGNPAKPFPK
jgi:UDP-3-O-[3-hydroxymyristoyl] glucosamine N-acyltransferase